MQTDVTERVRVEREREAAFAAEQAARQEAELARAIAEQARARRRARPGRRRAGAGPAGADGRGDERADRHAGHDRADRPAGGAVRAAAGRLGVPHPGRRVRPGARRPRPGTATAGRTTWRAVRRAARAAPAAGLTEPAEHGDGPRRCCSRTSRRRCSQTVFADPERRREPSSGSAARSVLTVPLVARRRTLGAIALVMADGRRGPSPRTTSTSPRTSPRRAALAMDNVRLYQREHAVADTLQRSLLPELPEVAGHRVGRALRQRVVARPTSAATSTTCWHLPDGSVGIVVGDVVGHDVAAAAAMGHLRGLLRACIWDAEDADPGSVLGARGPAGPGPAGRLAGDDGLRPRRAAVGGRRSRGGCTWPTPATRRCCCARPTARSACSTEITGHAGGRRRLDATARPSSSTSRPGRR